jgi:hypothetical protein
VVSAVVATVAVNCWADPESGKDAGDRLQVACGGATLQARPTVSFGIGTELIVKLKLAVCPGTMLCPAPEIDWRVKGALVLVREKFAGVATPETVAVTEYGPPAMPLAVNIGAVARP